MGGLPELPHGDLFPCAGGLEQSPHLRSRDPEAGRERGIRQDSLETGWMEGRAEAVVGVEPGWWGHRWSQLGAPGRTSCSLTASELPGHHAGTEGEGSGDLTGGTPPPWAERARTESTTVRKEQAHPQERPSSHVSRDGPGEPRGRRSTSGPSDWPGLQGLHPQVPFQTGKLLGYVGLEQGKTTTWA